MLESTTLTKTKNKNHKFFMTSYKKKKKLTEVKPLLHFEVSFTNLLLCNFLNLPIVIKIIQLCKKARMHEGIMNTYQLWTETKRQRTRKERGLTGKTFSLPFFYSFFTKNN